MGCPRERGTSMAKGPKVEENIAHLRTEERAMWQEFREQAWHHVRPEGQWGPEPWMRLCGSY